MTRLFPFVAVALALALGLPHTAMAAGNTVELTVDGMVCGFCAQGIEKKLRQNAATADVYISLEHHLVAVSLKQKQAISDAELKKVLTESGYAVTGVKHTSQSLQALKAKLES